jgi:two-component system nitrate/nitrite response regulator NarL
VEPATPTIIVERSDLFRAGLIQTLASTAFRVRLSKAYLGELPAQLPLRNGVGLLIIGLDDQIQLTPVSHLKQQNPKLRILALNDRSDPEELESMIEAGIDSYMLKSGITATMLAEALDLIATGQTVLPQEFTRFIKLRRPLESDPVPQTACKGDDRAYLSAESALRSTRLTTREHEILNCLTQGASNKSIARYLNVAEATVKVHIKALLRKMQVQNRTQAAVLAVNKLKEADSRLPTKPSESLFTVVPGKENLHESHDTVAIFVNSRCANARGKLDQVVPPCLDGSAKDMSELTN